MLLPPSCNGVQRPPDGQAGMLGIPHGRQPLRPRYGLRWPFSAGRAERRPARCCAIVARPILSRRQHKAVVYPCSAR